MASLKDTPSRRREFLRDKLNDVKIWTYEASQKPKEPARIAQMRAKVAAFDKFRNSAAKAAGMKMNDEREKLRERIAFEDPDLVRADVNAFVKKYHVEDTHDND